MISVLQSKWFSGAAGILIYFLTTTVTLLPQIKHAQPSGPSGEAKPNITGAVAAISVPIADPEVQDLVRELRKEKEDLVKKRNDLNELAAHLENERHEMTQITQSVYQLQIDFDRNVLRIKEEETANLKRLAKVYAGMSPDSAATVFKQMEDPVVVKILVNMKDSETSPILESMAKKGDLDAKRVADLTERLRLSIKPTGKTK